MTTPGAVMPRPAANVLLVGVEQVQGGGPVEHGPPAEGQGEPFFPPTLGEAPRVEHAVRGDDVRAAALCAALAAGEEQSGPRRRAGGERRFRGRSAITQLRSRVPRTDRHWHTGLVAINRTSPSLPSFSAEATFSATIETLWPSRDCAAARRAATTGGPPAAGSSV